MNRNRNPSSLTLLAVVALVAACSGSTGGLGSVPTAAPIAVRAGPAIPDLDARPRASLRRPSDRAVRGTRSELDARADSRRPAPTPAGTMIVRAYFVLGGEPGSAGLVAGPARGARRRPPSRRAAMNALLAGPTAAESGRPDDHARRSRMARSLLGVAIKNGVATVDLSTEFDSGGGTASMQYRLGQVVYTLTQFPTVKSVVFQIEGETVTVFGSEGIVLDGPSAGGLRRPAARRSSSTGRRTAPRSATRREVTGNAERLRGHLPDRDPRRGRQDARR